MISEELFLTPDTDATASKLAIIDLDDGRYYNVSRVTTRPDATPIGFWQVQVPNSSLAYGPTAHVPRKYDAYGIPHDVSIDDTLRFRLILRPTASTGPFELSYVEFPSSTTGWDEYDFQGRKGYDEDDTLYVATNLRTDTSTYRPGDAILYSSPCRDDVHDLLCIVWPHAAFSVAVESPQTDGSIRNNDVAYLAKGVKAWMVEHEITSYDHVQLMTVFNGVVLRKHDPARMGIDKLVTVIAANVARKEEALEADPIDLVDDYWRDAPPHFIGDL